jgi:serine/threonine protein kinase
MEHRSPQYRRDDGPTTALLEPGLILGERYLARAVVGRGGMSEVRDGWDLKLGRPVAIKLLQPVAEDRPERRLRFQTEARATAALHSQHIVVVHDVGEHDGLPFIVMERLPGMSLADHIARGPLPPAFVRAVLDSVLAALTVAHDAGILHRDVKPGNILFTAAGEAKLADFGIAKTTDAAHTMTGAIVGTIPYLSPDRLIGKQATPADDLYAAGVVGYEALTGRRPFPQENIAALTHAILCESPPPLSALRPDVPPNLANVIERALTRDAAQRYHHAGAMRAALNDTTPATTPVRPPTRVLPAPLPPPRTYALMSAQREPPESHRKLWAAAIISVLILAIMLLAITASFSGAPPPMPASTSTPLEAPPAPAPAATDISSAPEPPPVQLPKPPGKKPKGGKGD